VFRALFQSVAKHVGASLDVNVGDATRLYIPHLDAIDDAHRVEAKDQRRSETGHVGHERIDLRQIDRIVKAGVAWQIYQRTRPDIGRINVSNCMKCRQESLSVRYLHQANDLLARLAGRRSDAAGIDLLHCHRSSHSL
jgi:hypothetical protein